MTSSLIQRSFAAGELGPPLHGRADQTKYETGLKKCRNFFVMRHGGVTNRSGSQYIAEVKSSAAKTYLMKFVFNDDQTYVIELGNQYMRFYRSGAQIVVSGVAAYNGATAYVPGNLVSSAGVNYYCIANTTGNAPPNATYWYALTGSIFEVPTPYVTADLPTLKFVQSGDIVTITHPNYEPRELARTGHTAWTLTVITFAPSISAPGAPTVLAAGAGASVWAYKVTAIKSETYEESLPSSAGSDTGDPPTSTNTHTISWSAVSGAAEYNIYREYPINSGNYSFIGTATSTSFTNDGIEPDTSITPPIARNPFSGSGNYPSTATYYQQRRMFASSDNAPEKVWGSRTGMPKNMTISSPLQDDDAATFSMQGRKVNEVRHMVEVDELVILTSGGEWVVLGDSDGVLRANQPANLKQRTYNGASDVMPVIIGNTVIYVQARGTILRDFRQDLTEGVRSKDLSIFSPHLFEGYTIDRMDYAQIPHSIVWCVRSDGKMIGLTYLREHEVWGWHWHDTDGVYEDVCVVPEGNEDAIYVVVKRTIDGSTKRYIERFASRTTPDDYDVKVDALFLDSYLTYDGRNTGSTTMTLSTAGGWTVDDEITVTASAGYFVAGDVGNAIVFLDGTDEIVRINISTYDSATVVRGYPSKTVPSAVRSVALTTWGKAVDGVSGLGHLEAKDVSALGDGDVIANPNNDDYELLTVASGALTFTRPYLIVHVGLPYLSDFQTLDIDVQGEQLRDSKKNITSISLLVEKSRGGFVGPDEDNLVELRPQAVQAYNTPPELVTGLEEINITATWEQSGSFFVRQSDPLPMTILSAIPNGNIGG